MSLIPNTGLLIDNELDQFKKTLMSKKGWIWIRQNDADPTGSGSTGNSLYLGVLLKGGRAEAGMATHCLMSIRSTSMAARSNMLWMKVPSRPSSCFCTTTTWSKICILRRGKEHRRGQKEGRLCTLYSKQGRENRRGYKKGPLQALVLLLHSHVVKNM